VAPIRPLRLPWAAGLLAGLLLCTACSSAGSTGSATTARGTSPGSPAGSVSASPTSTPATGTPTTSSPSAATTPAAPAKPPVGEACVQRAFAELTTAQRAGQLVMSGVPVASPGSGRAQVRRSHLGGVFLAGRTSTSPTAVRRSVALLPGQRTAHTSIGVLVSTDQEGGKVQTLRGGRWTTIPAATVQARWSRARLTSTTTGWAKQLRSAGVTMDLAPVADTVPAGTASRNPPIGHFDRQYGSTSTAVAAKIAVVTSAMKAAGVIPTVKHFPGLGRVRYNTDTSARAVDATTTVTDPFLKPFQTGIRSGAGAVMISSARYPKLDPHNLAVFSPAVITGLLRTRMKYQGVAITDDVSKAVAVSSVPVGQRATRFIAAGGDMVLTVLPKYAPTMVAAIVKATAGRSFRAQLNAATVRVLRLKQTSGLLTCSG
jgi:beta-N-acetylhexosaminidase